MSATPAQNNTNAAADTGTQPAAPAVAPLAETLLSKPEDDATAPAEGSLLGSEEPASDKPEAQTAPEKYEAFTMPEGFSLGDDLLSEFTTAAKAANLSQGNAQAMLNLAAKHIQTMADSQRQGFADMRKNWVDSIKGDSEFGGPKFKETITRAQRTLKNFGDPEIKSFLNDSGFGDNPGLIKLLAKVDRALGENQTPTDDKPGAISGPVTLESALYGNG